MKPKQNTIAIVYDFDGTLSPGNMQEPTIFAKYKINPEEFWKKSERLVIKEGYERTLAYMKLLMHDPIFEASPLSHQSLTELGSRIKYFKGVESYFVEIQNFLSKIQEVKEYGIQIEHYIVSSGSAEILQGCSIARYFKKIYACEFAFDGDRPVFPKLVINDTNKTQFLFRINKGRLDLSADINSHMPEDEKPIPFRNMIYIGDGYTDIPSMTVTKKNGGYAIAVYPPGETVPEEIQSMVADGRADHFAPADYRESQRLTRILHRAIKRIVADIVYRTSSEKSRAWVRNKRIHKSHG